MDYLVEVPADQIGDIAEGLQRGGVDLPDAEVCIHQVDAEGGGVEQRLELDGALAHGVFGLRALDAVSGLARQQIQQSAARAVLADGVCGNASRTCRAHGPSA